MKKWFFGRNFAFMNYKKILACGALLAATGVVLGAFGAHALKKILEPAALEIYKTGVYYHQIHALALLLLGGLMHALPTCAAHLRTAARWLLAGVGLFSGSLYLLSFKQYLAFNWAFVGILTPIGGVCLVVGWCYAAWVFIKK
jgi:uncharacterized membrane protein YgdD (TMEM256/DUF423 family)